MKETELTNTQKIDLIFEIANGIEKKLDDTEERLEQLEQFVYSDEE